MIQRAMNALAGSVIVILCLGLPSCSTVPESKATKNEKRTDMRNMANDTLQQLYGRNPDTERAVKQSAGYAVFSDVGFKLMFMGGANGAGVAISNTHKMTYYMKMVELQPGFGLGAAKFRVIFLFDTNEAFNDFVTKGWEAGANEMTAAKTSTTNEGGDQSMSVAQGVKMYQVTEEGLIVGVSITGAKFYKDSDLN